MLMELEMWLIGIVKDFYDVEIVLFIIRNVWFSGK